MKIIITGATGLLGREVMNQLDGHKVIGTGFSRADGNICKLDLTDFNSVQKFLQLERPNVVIHCAAEKRPDVAAKNELLTMQLNADSSRLLGKLSKELGFLLIYISTDYVFDGTHPPYQIYDEPNPLNFYGKSKLAGEKGVLEENPDAVILRVPILYGKCKYNGESAVNMLVDAVIGEKVADMDDYMPRFPTNVEDVGKCLNLMLEKYEFQKFSGIYQFSAKQKLTKYQMCECIGRALNKKICHLTPIREAPKDPVATRPVNCEMSTSRLDQMGVSIQCQDFEKWFEEYLKTS